VIVGRGTVKSDVEVEVTPLEVTTILPVVAPEGTVTVSSVDVAAVTVALVLLNVTTLSVRFVLKFVPVMVTVDPTSPVAGLKDVMAVWGKGSSFLHWVRSRLNNADAISDAIKRVPRCFIMLIFIKP
jgi:hypothetical protein